MNIDILKRAHLASMIAGSGMTKVDICNQAGINRVTLNLHLKGSTSMSVDNLVKVLKVLADR